MEYQSESFHPHQLFEDRHHYAVENNQEAVEGSLYCLKELHDGVMLYYEFNDLGSHLVLRVLLLRLCFYN